MRVCATVDEADVFESGEAVERDGQVRENDGTM